MSGRCKTCAHPQRDEIDRLLLRRTPTRKIAARFEGLSRTSIQRHAEAHIPTQLARAEEAAELLSVEGLVDDLYALINLNKSVLEQLAERGEHAAVLGLMKERRHLLGVELSLMEAAQRDRSRQQDAVVRLREVEARERATQDAIQAAGKSAAREIVRELLTP